MGRFVHNREFSELLMVTTTALTADLNTSAVEG